MIIVYALRYPILLLVLSLVLGLYIITPICIWDIYARTKEYYKLKKRRINKRIMDRYKGSLCQRCVITSLEPKAKDYYKESGYRVYHIIPDEWRENPKTIFRLFWWKRFFNIK